MAWCGSLTNYKDLCELYSGCDRVLAKHDPAQLVLTLYLQVCTLIHMIVLLSAWESGTPILHPRSSVLASSCVGHMAIEMSSCMQGYKDMYDDNSSQPQTWLAAAEVPPCLSPCVSRNGLSLETLRLPSLEQKLMVQRYLAHATLFAICVYFETL